jgi:hypothetical protein
MAKRPSIKTITSGYSSTTTLNENFTALKEAFDNTVSRDGSVPNTMSADLDLNGNDITNVNTLTDANGDDFIQVARDSAAGAQAAQTAAEAAQTAAETAQTGAETAYNSVQPYLDEIEVVGDDLTAGSFVAGSEYDFGLITDATSGTSGSPDGFIVTVYNNLDDIGIVAANDANITTVAGISAEVTSVAGNEANIATVGTISADITSVAGISADVTTVAGNTANINSVAADAVDIGTVATDIANVNSVAGNTTNINAVAANATNINAVAADATDIGTVAGLNTEIGALGAITADITTAAGNTADITTVAGVSANVTTVAGISADVSAVATNNANVTAVAGNATNINTVAGDSADINTLAPISTDITTAAANSSNITTVAGINANVTTVAGISADVTAVAADSTDIGTVATNIANVNNVGADIANVNTVAANLASVNNFGEQYRIGATEPTTSLDTGDLFYDTTASALKVYTGTGWEQGVTAGSGFLPLSGGTLTGALSLPADPTNPLQVATKQYVDTIAAAGIHYHTPVRVETPTALNATYDNGTDGVGATLTNAGTQAAIVIDGVTLSSADRVLVYNQANAAHNGIYTVTDVGSASTNWVLTRATDADSYGASDPNSLGEGDAYFVKEGATGAGELYVMNTAGEITFGTTNITFTVIAETAVYSAGDSLTLTGTTFDTAQDIRTTASPTFNNITVTGTVDGRDVAADGTKLDGIEAGANVTDAANVEPLVDAHINVSGATSGQYLGWNGSDYAWSTVDLSTKLDLSGGVMTGTISFAAGQTFDGRDVSADGAKLDGIEAGATGDQTASEILTAIKTVDGSGSGLDADTLDGQQGSYYYPASNPSGYTTFTANQSVNTSSNVTFEAIYANDWFRVNGNDGFYWQTHNGGWMMTDSSWVRSYGDKGVLTGGTMQAGNFNTTSDIKLKENVVTLENSLDKIKAMRGVSFDWKDSGKSTIGLIAQEVEQVLPELVEHNQEDDVKTVSYANIVAVLIEAIKEQQVQIDALKEKLGE